MPKSDSSLPLEDYSPVADRIELFYSAFPEGRITTKLLSPTQLEIIVKAFVYRGPTDALPAATGYASERIGDGPVNMYACLENTETSAIGRALANLGFAASRKTPSREEMEKVERARNNVAYRMPAKAPWREKVAEIATIQPLDASVHRDVLILLERARDLGFSALRADEIRKRVGRNPALPIEDCLRLEKNIRSWIIRHSRNVAKH